MGIHAALVAGCMPNVPAKIYKQYHQLNIFNKVYGKSVKYGSFFIIFLFILIIPLYNPTTVHHIPIGMMILLGLIVSFFKYTEKRYVVKYGNHESRKQKREDWNAENIRIELLYQYIKQENLNTLAGIEYLTKFYGKKQKTRQFTGIGIGIIVISAIINNGLYFLLMADDTSRNRLFVFLHFMQQNMPTILVMLFLCIITIISLKKDFEFLGSLKDELFSKGYDHLIEILEGFILPRVLIEQNENAIYKNIAK